MFQRHLQLLLKFQQSIRTSPTNSVAVNSLFHPHPIQHIIPNNMLTLSVDGNISSGKSTLVSKLTQFFPKGVGVENNVNGQPVAAASEHSSVPEIKVEVIPEPLEKWCDLQGYNLLEMFYTSPEKNNFLFQHYVQLTRLMDTVRRDPAETSGSRNSSGNNEIKIRIMERSLQNNRYCFLELAKRSGKLHPAEFAVLVEWYDWLEKNMELKLDLIIYLKTKPETAYERMKARARAAEDSCSYEYLMDLHESYEDWLIRRNQENPNAVRQHVIVVDADKSRDEVAAQCFSMLRDYLTTLTNIGKIEGQGRKRKFEEHSA